MVNRSRVTFCLNLSPRSEYYTACTPTRFSGNIGSFPTILEKSLQAKENSGYSFRSTLVCHKRSFNSCQTRHSGNVQGYGNELHLGRRPLNCCFTQTNAALFYICTHDTYLYTGIPIGISVRLNTCKRGSFDAVRDEVGGRTETESERRQRQRLRRDRDHEAERGEGVSYPQDRVVCRGKPCVRRLLDLLLPRVLVR